MRLYIHDNHVDLLFQKSALDNNFSLKGQAYVACYCYYFLEAYIRRDPPSRIAKYGQLDPIQLQSNSTCIPFQPSLSIFGLRFN